MRQMQKMGPLKNVLGMLPGVNPADAQGGEHGRQELKHVEAIVLSMTPKERPNPDLHERLAPDPGRQGLGPHGAGSEQLLAQFKQMQKVMKSAGKPGGRA